MKKPFLVANSKLPYTPEIIKLELTKLFIARKYITHTLLYLEDNTYYAFDKGLNDNPDSNMIEYYQRLSSGQLSFIDVTGPAPETFIDYFISLTSENKKKNIYYMWLTTTINDASYYGDSKGFDAVKDQYRITREQIDERLNTMFKD